MSGEDVVEEIEDEIGTAFRRSVVEGEGRLARTVPDLLATGFVGGVDVSIGVLALLVVRHETGSVLLGTLAFSIGFIALTLANSELFTENFLIPVATVAARRGSPWSLVRLWLGTLVANLAGGWIVTWLIITAIPDVHPTAVELGQHFVQSGVGSMLFASAVLGGLVVTLMTWMQRATDSVPARLIAAVASAFLLAAAGLDHAVVGSLEMFAALHGHAPFGYADWARTQAFATLGNVVGGIGLVTVLRLVQVGGEGLRGQQPHPT